MSPEIGTDIGQFPALRRILDSVLTVWPEHDKFIKRSFADRDHAMLVSCEQIASMILDLESDDLPGLCNDYRWMCAQLQEAEIDFRRSGKYRHTSFAEAERAVYSNSAFMAPYIRGLLLSHVMWFNHAAAIDFYVREFLPTLPSGTRLLDVGPGHGLMLCLAAKKQRRIELTGWDVSAMSVELTRAALTRLGVGAVDLKLTDVCRPIQSEKQFDAIMLCEVLEHLEDPGAALSNLRPVLAPNGRIFVSVPLNSPAPDHIYLLRSPSEAVDLIERSGYRVTSARHFPTGGYSLERAERLSITISSVIVAEGR